MLVVVCVGIFERGGIGVEKHPLVAWLSCFPRQNCLTHVPGTFCFLFDSSFLFAANDAQTSSTCMTCQAFVLWWSARCCLLLIANNPSAVDLLPSPSPRFSRRNACTRRTNTQNAQTHAHRPHLHPFSTSTGRRLKTTSWPRLPPPSPLRCTALGGTAAAAAAAGAMLPLTVPTPCSKAPCASRSAVQVEKEGSRIRKVAVR